MRRAVLIGMLFCLGAAPAASAQNVNAYAGLMAAGVEGFGQTIGEAAVGGSSVFVTATGHAGLPAPIADAYLINIEGQSASAVEASKVHDDRLKTAQSIARQFNVAVDIGSTSFSREEDQLALMRRNARMQAQFQAQRNAGAVATPMMDQPQEPERVFVVRTGVRFRASNAAQFPAFLDALKAAGVDNLSGNLGGPSALNMFRSSEVLGFGALAKVDEAIWDRASQDAMAAARRQAQVLAAASGREVGDVKQILFLTRSVEGDEVSVMVAARFGFAPAK
jgi:hypothetical protein